ncbi:hypothetical protein [Streptomyces nigra]
MAVEWDRVGQPGFDRIVEALVHRVYDATARVEAVNGRGGDDGIDIKVTHGSRVRVFQLKYYPDGFPTTAHKGRRKSIRQSFARALQHQPWEWILVVPCTLTTAEREFVTSLAAGQAVRVGVWDRAKLDGLLATHADLEASFTRDQLFEAAKVYGQERALLMDGVRDVSARVTALGRQVDGLDDHWTVDFARQGKTVVHTLRAKHPRAHEVSPVEITLTGNGPLTPDLAQAVRRSLGFGLPEEVVLPRGAVESLTVSGPEWLSGEHRDVEVRTRAGCVAGRSRVRPGLGGRPPRERAGAGVSGVPGKGVPARLPPPCQALLPPGAAARLRAGERVAGASPAEAGADHRRPGGRLQS